ncbi:MAG: GTP cyclohydrolase I FolE2 [Burkholderiaceae bacterium]|nr:MAG: GTP cyclohydrolase I FolE2 [Burkholderiaceae bacterium]
MNLRDPAAAVALPIPDVQSSLDTRQLVIQRVGVKDIRYPVQIRTADGTVQSSVANISLFVHLPAEQKGTHMSRFIALLEARREPLDVAALKTLGAEMLERLEADNGHVEISYPYFITKRAPVSGVESLLDYDVSWLLDCNAQGVRTTLQLKVPVTSLCPCSKKISEYGAHNQRSIVTITVELRGEMTVEQLVRQVEDQASCELYGLLKRPDEKYVTERAYDNPKFVEDLVRDVAGRLNAEPRIGHYVVEAENFESIHNHSAYALIERI